MLDLSVLPAGRRRFPARLGAGWRRKPGAARAVAPVPDLADLVAQLAVDVLGEVLLLFDQAPSGPV